LKTATGTAPSVTLRTPKGPHGEARRNAAVSDLLSALQSALNAADPAAILEQAMSLRGDTLHVGPLTFDLAAYRRVLVIGAGKATGKMAAEVERLLGSRVTGGVVIVPEYQKPLPKCKRIILHRATHPIPSGKGVEGARKVLSLVGHATENDFILCLLSGGGSALMPLPARGVTLRDKQRTTELLLKCGAEISETNAVRKHLSAIKGGRLAEKLYPATVLSLIISDVAGDAIDAIASGPTAPDSTTYGDAMAVLKKYYIWDSAPASVRSTITRGVRGEEKETPKEGSFIFRNVNNMIVGSTRVSCAAAADVLRKKGYRTLILSTMVRGEARDVGRLLAGILKDMVTNNIPLSPPACIVAGGETTVTVHGSGVGGRNQELVMAAALELERLPGVYIASMGTDGLDGPTDAAGALAGGESVVLAKNAGLDPRAYLRNNDSNTFFKRVGGLLVTGPTGTNVNDIMVAMARKRAIPEPLL
jgi:glycerate 2-kinase